MNTYYEAGTPIPNDPEGYSLEVSVDYTLGGANYWTGGQTPRGLKVRFIPIKRSVDGGVRWTRAKLGDSRGRSFHVVDLSRKSPKRGKELAAFVESRKDNLLDLAILEDWNGVASILREFQ